MNAPTELIDAIVRAVESIDGLRPAVPPGVQNAKWMSRAGSRYAVELEPHEVEVRVLATALPLPSLLDTLAVAIRSLLASTPWADTTLRLVVVGLDAASFGDPTVT